MTKRKSWPREISVYEMHKFEKCRNRRNSFHWRVKVREKQNYRWQKFYYCSRWK